MRRFRRWRIRRKFRKEQEARLILPAGKQPKDWFDEVDEWPVVEI